MKTVFLRAALVLMGGVVILAGCAHPGELRMQIDRDVQVPPRRVLVFFVDGMWADRIQELCKAGELPNIKKYLYDRGCCVENAVSSFPSITYACIASAATGQFPGHHQIMGNHWFDRSSGKFQDYMFMRSYQEVDRDLGCPTIYEVLRDKYTVTIQTANRRGSTRPYDNWMSSGINWFFGRHLEVDRLVAQRFEEIATCSGSTGRWPDYVFAYFPATDHVGHAHGASSEEYRKALINVDEQIGRICRALEENGLLKDYYLIFVSDHGHEAVAKEKYWVPQEYLRKCLGLRVVSETFLEKGEPCQWHHYLRDYRVVFVDGGPRQGQIFLRCSNSWIGEPTYEQARHFLRDYAPQAYEAVGKKDLVDLLIEQPSIRVVAMKVDRNTVEVVNTQGRARILRQVDAAGKKSYRYQPLENDPLGYRDCKDVVALLDGKFHDADAWLQASCRTEFPDFVPQMVEMCDSPRAGQIEIYARQGWDFECHDLGGHGSVVHNDMIIPFVLAGPNIRHGTIKTARLVDVFPTVLDMLGCTDRLKTIGPIDGRSILPQVTSSSSK